MKRLPLLLVVIACACLAGCSTLSSHRDSDVKAVKRVYVEHLLTDNHRLDELITNELRARGYEASYGPLTMMPKGMDAIVSYRERTAWDFKSYVIELNVEAKAPFTGKTLAVGRYYQPSMRPKEPGEVVRLVIDGMFPRR